MGMYSSELRKLKGKTIRDKLKNAGVKKIPINITLEKAIELLKKKTRN
jgi:ribosomal 50S subunit-associated protein YjgA (DUF615 family)